MKNAVQQAGIATPAFSEANCFSDVRDFFSNNYQVPLVIKPRRQAASSGVSVCRDLNALRTAWEKLPADDRQVEAFVEGEIFHVDGVVWQGKILYAQPSVYLGSCLEFNQGKPLGSIQISNDLSIDKIRNFCANVCQSLELHSSVFHLELIYTVRGQLVFLEIGARVGGGPIPLLWEKSGQPDLVFAAISCQLNIPPSVDPSRTTAGESSGFVMLPPANQFPHRLKEIVPLNKKLPSLIYQEHAAPQTEFIGPPSYYNLAGTYLFRGKEEQIRAEIIYLMKNFSYSWEFSDTFQEVGV
jgi:hypothetical protein